MTMKNDPDSYESRKGRDLLRRGIVILGIILLAVVILCAAFRTLRSASARLVRDFMSPYLSAGSFSVEKIQDQMLLKRSKRELILSVNYLQRRVAALESALAAKENAVAENRELRKMLNLPEKEGLRSVRAGIIARNPSTWRQNFVLGKGSADGIRAGDAVAAFNSFGRIGFAGRVVEVTRHTAVVATLFSPDCKVSVSLDSGETGTMSFSEEQGTAVVSDLPLDGDYAKGRTFRTSGLSDLTPSGLPVGVIRSFPDGKTFRSPDRMNAEVLADPFLRIDTIRFAVVFVRVHPSGKPGKQ